VNKSGDLEGPVDETNRLTYREFSEKIDNVSSALYHRYGVRKGDRVAIMLKNVVEYLLSFFASAKIGAIVVPLNTALKGEEMDFQVKDSGASILITDSEFHELIADVTANIPAVRHIITTGEPIKGTIPFPILLSKGRPLPEIPLNEMDSAIIMYTSGTTGRPKGAVLTHKNVIASAMNSASICELQPERDKMLVIVPLFHVTGLGLAMCSAVFAGIPIVLMKKYKTADMLKVIAKERITAMFAVPTILWLMLNAPELAKYDLSCLHSFGAGGGAAPEELMLLCAQKLPGLELMPGYGLSETVAGVVSTTSLKEALTNLGTVGRPLPLVDIRIVDISGKNVPQGEPGEILIRGCQVMKEYWNNPQATRETLVDGWLHTSDIGKVTEDGYIYILDRTKDMINRGGEKIYSLEVENLLYRHPKVLEAAVVGVPDVIFGEQVKTAIVLKLGERATAEEIQEYCGKYLSYYKVPKYVEFRETLPRNPAGKVIKSKLR
ncbi:class I adenylate-forming enzyme family protein, partial [Chloroflexota bacterium]